MKIKTLIFYALLSLSMCGTVYAGPIVHRDGAVIPSGATLDIVDVEDWNVPAMQAAGAGFGESPIWRTDANTVTLKSATGQSITLAFNADNGEDNSDKWKLVAADGGNVTLQTYASGAWVTVATWTSAGGVTLTGAIAGATVNTGQGSYELYDMDQNVLTTSSPTFVTAKLSGLTDGYIPKHTADATGLENSSLFYSSAKIGLGTTAPDAAFEINHATGDSMRLTYNDADGSAANYTDFAVTSGGNLTVTPSGSHVGIVGGQSVKKTNVSDANYGTSALTLDYIVAFTALTAARTATISTEDEDSGTTTQPRVMIFKDESGSAATYNITISLESGGTIDGAANFVIDQPYQSVTIYLNGTNGYIY